MGVLCFVTFHPLYELSDYTVVVTALGPTVTMCMLAIAPVSLRCCFHQVTSIDPLKSGRSQDCSNDGARPTVGAMGAAQTLAWPTPHV